MVGLAATVTLTEVDTQPPGAGFEMETLAVPAFTPSAAGMAAFKGVESTKVVVRFEPFHRTTEEAMKPEPVTPRVKAEAPAVNVEGESDTSEGKGLGGAGC